MGYTLLHLHVHVHGEEIKIETRFTQTSMKWRKMLFFSSPILWHVVTMLKKDIIFSLFPFFLGKFSHIVQSDSLI